MRRATGADAEPVRALAADMAVSFTVDDQAFHRSFDAVVDASDAHLLVVDAGTGVGGYLLGFEHPAFFANGPVAWVEEIAVQPDLRRLGLGSLLMSTFEDEARGRGCALVALATHRASSFYETIGYHRYATYYRKNLRQSPGGPHPDDG